VIDPDNFDFFFLDPAGLAVALFGALFVVAGLALAPLADRWGPGVPRLFYRQDVTLVGGIALAVAVVLGLLELGRDIAELV
jgi:MFS family permease